MEKHLQLKNKTHRIGTPLSAELLELALISHVSNLSILIISCTAWLNQGAVFMTLRPVKLVSQTLKALVFSR